MKFNDRTMALLGIPDLPPRAFIRKADGGIIPQGGGSGPSSTSTSTTGLPDWAKGYAQETLAKQNALSDVPYQTYDADRIQGLTPMQEEARKAAVGMDAGSKGFGTGVKEYMSPYQQNVTDIQKREAARQSGIQGTQQQAQAAGVGAFGGSRDAIMRAERERNLGQQMGDIQARGDQANYEQAGKQFREGITQNMDINRLQSAYGAQQQALGQQGLDQAYQDFQNQRNYPQQQLSNMASMMRGLPIGSTTNASGTSSQGSPSFGQMIGSGITGLYGLKNFFADGGSVDSQQNIENIVHKLSDQQLNQAEHAAKVRGDAEQMRAIQTEKAARASMKNGLASLPVDMDKMLPTEQSMARGGIVAFALGGKSGDPDTDIGPAQLAPELDEEDMRKGLLRKLYKDYQTPTPAYTEQTPEQRLAAVMAARKELIDSAGPSQYNEERENIKRMQEANAANLKQGKGLAALQAAAAMLQGNDLARGLGAGAAAFGQAYGASNQASQTENRALEAMRINLADAERKEKMGLHREAQALVATAEQNRRAAHSARQDENYRQRTNMQGILTATKPEKEATAAKLPEAALAAMTAYRQNPTSENKIKAEAAMEVLSAARTTFGTSEAGPGKREDVASALDQAAVLKRETEAQADKIAKEKLAQEAQLKREATVAAALKAVENDALIDSKMRKLKKEDPTEYDAEIKRRVEARVKAANALAGSLANPAPVPAPVPIPLPANATEATLVNDKVYLLPGKGPAKWNAATKKFTSVAP